MLINNKLVENRYLNKCIMEIFSSSGSFAYNFELPQGRFLQRIKLSNLRKPQSIIRLTYKSKNTGEDSVL